MTRRTMSDLTSTAAARVTNTTTRKSQAMRECAHVALCGLLTLTFACGGLPIAPAHPKQGDAFLPPQTVPRPGMPGDKPVPFTLQPGDIVDIDIASDPPRSLTDIVVDSTGRVHMPMVGDVEVGGQGLTEAEGRIQGALRRFDRFAEVSVKLKDPKGQRITVLGAVATQGSVQLAPAARVADVIAAAGGPLNSSDSDAPVPLADLAGAIVTRKGQPLPISVARALQGDALHNVYLHPGDSVYIPPALGNNVSVLGQVGSARVFTFRQGLRLSQALAIAGGVTVGADKGDIRVIRGTLERPRVYKASLQDLVDGDVHDVALQPGDIIFVTDDAIEDIGEVVALIAPALSLGLSAAVLATTLNPPTQSAAPAPPTAPADAN